jgi:glycosyltransferase involved in cell wall biosynthesis
MDFGGVEKWLLGIAEELKSSDIEMNILVHTDEPGALDHQFKCAGVKIIPVLGFRNPLKYIFDLMHVLKSEGPYDVVHSHVLYFSGIVLLVARLAKVPIRISHAHSNRSHIEPNNGLRAIYINLMKKLVRCVANKYVAVSQEAHLSLHTGIVSKQKLEVLYCGVKGLDRIEPNSQLKTELGIPKNKLILGHVGRISEPKNHKFIIDVFKELTLKVDAVLVLVGDGELINDVKDYVKQQNLIEDVVFLGTRSDAVNIMFSVFDVMIFPSLYEGLPLTVVEAQAVGCPILVADNITKEVEFDASFISYYSLKCSANEWAVKLIELSEIEKANVDTEKFRSTDFYLPNHLDKLKKLYYGEL